MREKYGEDYSVTALCQFMKVSRSCYYEWLNSPKTEREKEKYIILLKALFEKGRGSYDTHRLKNKFAKQGIIISRRRIGRLMKQAGLWCKTKNKFKATTNSKHNKPIAPNLLERQFTVSQADRLELFVMFLFSI